MQRTDETVGEGALMPAAEQPVELSSARQVARFNRRRLVQGAAVAVPTILTLRSGGIAAASLCPGQIAGTATVNPDGTLTDYQQITGPLRTDDVCFSQVTACTGDTTHVSSASPADILGSVTPTPNSQDVFTCGTYVPPSGLTGTTTDTTTGGTKKKKKPSSGTTTPTTGSQTVVILTHSSAVSLL